MILEILIAGLISFLAVLVSGQFLVPILAQIGLTAQDINKRTRPILPTSGGLIFMLGLFAGTLALIFSANYIVNTEINVQLLLLALISAVAISMIGFIDDLIGGKIRLSRENLKKMASNYALFNGGIKQWQKPVLTLIAVLPLMMINWGTPVINIPFIGAVQINQVLFTLLFIPIAVIFSANVFNMLEGLNGLSLQMGLVAFIALGLFSFHIQSYTAFAIAVISVGGLLAYIYYGSYPAKILPGDSLTYLIGGTFAITVIIGNMEALGVILLIPWFAEFILKARRRFHANSWGIVQRDDRLKSPHGNKIYSLTHIFLRTGRFKEWQIVSLLTVVEVVVAAIGLLIVW